MASVLQLIFAVLLLHIFAEIVASQPCDLTSIQVQQNNTGAKVGYDPVFEVEVKNLCRCSVASVFLRSEGFASSKLVDPKLFRREGNDYLVNDGKSIQSSLSVKFSYAWDRAFRMSAESFQIQKNCK
ncbi:TPD1 protein homolog 1-like [Zingiber officinale]|uniref:Uncharacterized protein n=1 Tax=Zingiber officinale TaxID=94328 RepID=A0A8J5F8Z9_ZINOF|nr:TPD1 protein homolog 1-like [Zingiber officinale]XP_042429661.1 TPD1 protein homolog 1-like [Zingiber officinale]KAG6481948.1 hypothetical protein ZIOFF_058572 [Zingiber officinale]KAG6485806.1 hypothetical protein ZIOFF_054371 [Zingiber officinale]